MLGERGFRLTLNGSAALAGMYVLASADGSLPWWVVFANAALVAANAICVYGNLRGWGGDRPMIGRA